MDTSQNTPMVPFTTKKATPAQIDKWKKEFNTPTIHHLQIPEFGKRCYLRQPKREDISQAAVMGAQDPLAFNLHILTQCWISGDDEIKENDGYFMSVSGLLTQIIGVSQATLEKL